MFNILVTAIPVMLIVLLSSFSLAFWTAICSRSIAIFSLFITCYTIIKICFIPSWGSTLDWPWKCRMGKGLGCLKPHSQTYETRTFHFLKTADTYTYVIPCLTCYSVMSSKTVYHPFSSTAASHVVLIWFYCTLNHLILTETCFSIP